MNDSTKVLMTAAMGGLLLAATSFSPAMAEGAAGEAAKGECHGVNSCKGTGECGGQGHGCAGKNACKGQGWIKTTKAECDEKGGTFKGE